MRRYPELKHLDRNQKIIFSGKEMTIREFIKEYDLENENSSVILMVINKLIKKGKIKLIGQQEVPTQVNKRQVQINQGIQENTTGQIKNENQQKDGISFDECLKKHFPMQAHSLTMVRDYLHELNINSASSSLYEMTLDFLKSYKGNYQLAEVYLGALIMHVKLGNITGYDLEELFEKLNWTEEFKYDVMYRLKDNMAKSDVKAENENNRNPEKNLETELKRKEIEHTNAVSEKMLIEYLTLEAENGNVEIQLLLGDMYLKGIGVEEDDVEAVKWYSMAVALGNAEAMSKLGEMYQYGYGVKANDFEAVKWYKKAAERNSANGQFRLGWMYEAGRGGLPRDLGMALKYYRLAAKQEHKMAIMYAQG